MKPSNFIEELRWRGMLHDLTEGMDAELSRTPHPLAYIGFDPTAASPTLGNYVPVMVLILFQKYGGTPVVLLGGATGRIGDPSFKSAERQLLDIDTIEHNINAFRKIMQRLLRYEGVPNPATIIDNYDIYKDMNALSFLRDVGKHITVNYMMAKDSVQNRLKEGGISFTEFSYQLLQGYDFAWLYKNMDCRIQMGGSDQWGNITTGTTFISKLYGAEAKGYACTIKLLTKKDGTKFGKSEKGNIWLDSEMTSPYQFYQFWINADDDDIVKYSRWFSLKSHEEIEALEAEHQANLGARTLQRALGEEMTRRLHGDAAFELASAVTAFFFAKKMSPEELRNISADVLEIVHRETVSPSISAASLEGESNLRDLLVEAGCFASNGEVNRAIKENALSLNKVKVTQATQAVTSADLLHGRYLLVDYGKKTSFMLKVNA